MGLIDPARTRPGPDILARGAQQQVGTLVGVLRAVVPKDGRRTEPRAGLVAIGALVALWAWAWRVAGSEDASGTHIEEKHSRSTPTETDEDPAA